MQWKAAHQGQQVLSTSSETQALSTVAHYLLCSIIVPLSCPVQIKHTGTVAQDLALQGLLLFATGTTEVVGRTEVGYKLE